MNSLDFSPSTSSQFSISHYFLPSSIQVLIQKDESSSFHIPLARFILLDMYSFQPTNIINDQAMFHKSCSSAVQAP